MARIQQDTVQYFPHDIAASDGDTMTIIEANFGNDGYAFWFKLLEKLGRTPGHYIDCNNTVKMDLLSAKSHITTSNAITILEMLCQLGAIDKELWQNRVIWSQHFVDNVQDVYTNRKRTAPAKPVITSSNPITNSSNSTDTHDEKITTSKSTQSKVKESKTNKSKGKNIKKESTPAIDKKLYGSLLNVFLTDDEVTKGKAKFTDWNERLESFSLKKASHGYKYVDDYAAICTWARDDEKKGVGKSSSQNQPQHTETTKEDINFMVNELEKDGIK